MTKAGTRMETKSINGQNIRGVGFRPSSWLGKADGKEMPVPVALRRIHRRFWMKRHFDGMEAPPGNADGASIREGL